MKQFKKIFLLLLASAYILVSYSRIVHSSPYYAASTAKEASAIKDIKNISSKKSFILHRRHLSLIKITEIGKLYPTTTHDKNHFDILESNKMHFQCVWDSYFSVFISKHNNKSPPVIILS